MKDPEAREAKLADKREQENARCVRPSLPCQCQQLTLLALCRYDDRRENRPDEHEAFLAKKREAYVPRYTPLRPCSCAHAPASYNDNRTAQLREDCERGDPVALEKRERRRDSAKKRRVCHLPPANGLTPSARKNTKLFREIGRPYCFLEPTAKGSLYAKLYMVTSDYSVRPYHSSPFRVRSRPAYRLRRRRSARERSQLQRRARLSKTSSAA